jgi:hypothetical protein
MPIRFMVACVLLLSTSKVENQARSHMIRSGLTTHFAGSRRANGSVLKPSKRGHENIPTYSTLDVSRILGIEKSRVRNWIVKGFIIPSWHIAMARGDKNLLTYDDLCSVYLFQQLLSKGLPRTPIAFIIREIAKTGLSNILRSDFRYVLWNTKSPKEGGVVTIVRRIPGSTIDTSSQMWVVDLLEVKNEVDRKREKRGG